MKLYSENQNAYKFAPRDVPLGQREEPDNAVTLSIIMRIKNINDEEPRRA